MQIGTFARDNKQIEDALTYEPDFIDLRMDLNHSIIFTEAKRMLRESGVACTLHLPSSPDWNPLDIAKDIMPYVDLGREVDAELVYFHTTLSTLFYSDQDIEVFLSALPAVCDVVKDSGINMAIETLGLYYTELMLLFDAHPKMSMALDLGHGQIMAKRNRALGHIESFHEKIRMVIVHDNHGADMVDEVIRIKKDRMLSIEEMREIAHRYDEHLPIGEGHIDFIPLFRELKEHHYDGKFLLMSADQTRFESEREKFTDLWLQA
ncbi:MAG: sugar phosphate isomerase/epimerase [Candidatus Thorarchaeota archaeon]|nr:sugar phosphate isomerase/epimerase [Candidatus Thorarchaeota archaeon]